MCEVVDKNTIGQALKFIHEDDFLVIFVNNLTICSFCKDLKKRPPFEGFYDYKIVETDFYDEHIYFRLKDDPEYIKAKKEELEKELTEEKREREEEE